MNVREATPEDNIELQSLQSRCPMGVSLIVSHVNTPDFFARAKAYDHYKVYVACDQCRIVGSAALAIREGFIDGEKDRIGYEFQYFTSPDDRRKGVARLLHEEIEDYFTKEGVALSFLFIMEGNIPSIRFFEGQGFRLHRTVVMPRLLVYKRINVPSGGKIRPIRTGDLSDVADLLNETWHGYDFYQPQTAESLGQFLNRVPGYGYENVWVLEEQGKVRACVGYCDWSQITRLTVKALSTRLRMVTLLMSLIRIFRPMPRAPVSGRTLKDWCLTSIGFEDPGSLSPLFRHINNRAFESGIDQMFFVCERKHPVLGAAEGLFRIDVGVHLYIKPLKKARVGSNPVFLDGIDL